MFKKKDPKPVRQFIESGIHMEELEIQRRSLKNNFFKCLWNAFLIFSFLVGHLGFFVSAFELPCNIPVLALCCAGISMYMSFLYLTSLTYNIGYLALPFIVAFLSFSMYRIVNSGFSAIRTLMIKYVDKIMNLPTTREFNEYYSNRRVSITVCLAVISVLLAIFINMWVSRRRSAIYPILFTIIACEFSIYLSDDFSYLYLGIIILSIVLYILTKLNDSGEFIYKKRYRAYTVRRKEVTLNKSQVSRRSNLVVALILVVASVFAVIILTSGMSKLYFSKNTKLKEKTDKVVANVAAYGLQYYTGNSAGNGGMDNGKVGGVANVIQDGLTDITVDFVPYTSDEVFLPMFIGSTYNTYLNRWEEEKRSTMTDYQTTRYIMDYGYEHNDNKLFQKAAKMSMRIKNEDLDTVTFGVYYSSQNDKQWKTMDRQQAVIFRNFSPSLYNKRELLRIISSRNVGVNEAYTNAYIYDIYSQSDRTSIYSVQRICRNQNWKYTTPYYAGSIDRMSEDEILEVFGNVETLAKEEFSLIEKIKDYLRNNYIYTLAPGNTPRGYDPIEYFLNDNKKGYCVYFASSAALMLKHLGVPARYVEGYAFDITALDDAGNVRNIYGEDGTDRNIVDDGSVVSSDSEIDKIQEQMKKDGLIDGVVDPESLNDELIAYDGYNELGLTKDNMVEIELTDSNAHAWVEVYIYGFGWVPFEFTQANEVEASTGNDIISRLLASNGFFSDDTLNNDTTNNIIDNTKAAQAAIEKGFKNTFVIVIYLAIALFFIRKMITASGLYFVKKESRVVNQYRYISKMMREIMLHNSKKDREKYSEINNMIISHKEFNGLAVNYFHENAELVADYLSELVAYNYDDTIENKTELAENITKKFRKIKKNVKLYLPWYKRFITI